MRPQRHRTDHGLRWIALAASVLLMVIADTLQSTLGAFSLKAAVGTYAVAAIAGLTVVGVLKRRQRHHPRNRHPT